MAIPFGLRIGELADSAFPPCLCCEPDSIAPLHLQVFARNNELQHKKSLPKQADLLNSEIKNYFTGFALIENTAFNLNWVGNHRVSPAWVWALTLRVIESLR